MNLRVLLVICAGFFVLLHFAAWLLLVAMPAADPAADFAFQSANLGTLALIGAFLSVLVLVLMVWGGWQWFVRVSHRQACSDKVLGDILATSREGLLLIDRQLSMASPWSLALADIFAIDKLDDRDFPSLMRDVLPRKEANSTLGYLQSLFNAEINESDLLAINPLATIQLVVPNNQEHEQGELRQKTLSFSFRRLWSGNTIEHVVVSISDLSAVHELQQRLDLATVKADNRQRLLTAVYNANIVSLGKFIDQSYSRFSRIDQALSESVSNKLQCLEKLSQMHGCISQLAQEANGLALVELYEALQTFDKELVSLRDCDELRNQELFPLRQKLAWIIDYTAQVNAIFQSISRRATVNGAEPATHIPDTEPPESGASGRESGADLNGAVQNTLSSKRPSAWQHLYQLALDLSLRNEKQVELVLSGLDETPMSGPLREAINTLCTQFISNSVVHGIEPPWDRELMQKAALGRIDIHLSTVGEDNLELIIEDNGAGFDYERIRDQAIKSERWSATDVEHWDNKKLLSLIFLPGFSTAETVTEDAGSGVGMDLVMQKIKQLDGKIKLSSRKNEYSRFVVSLPTVGVAHNPNPEHSGVAA